MPDSNFDRSVGGIPAANLGNGSIIDPFHQELLPYLAGRDGRAAAPANGVDACPGWNVTDLEDPYKPGLRPNERPAVFPGNTTEHDTLVAAATGVDEKVYQRSWIYPIVQDNRLAWSAMAAAEVLQQAGVKVDDQVVPSLLAQSLVNDCGWTRIPASAQAWADHPGAVVYANSGGWGHADAGQLSDIGIVAMTDHGQQTVYANDFLSGVWKQKPSDAFTNPVFGSNVWILVPPA